MAGRDREGEALAAVVGAVESPWTPPKSGEYKLGARCYEGGGTLQPVKTQENFPSGTASIAFVTVNAT